MTNNDDDNGSNNSGNRTFQEVIEARVSRRAFLGSGLAAAAAFSLSGVHSLLKAVPAEAQSKGPLLGFQGIPVSTADTVVVPPGYTAEVLIAWGDPDIERSRVQTRCQQYRRGAGSPVGRAQRRLGVLPDPWLDKRATRAESRVCRRGLALSRRHRRLECRENQQIDQCPRRVDYRDREGRRQGQKRKGRRVAGRAAIALRAPHHGADSDQDRRSGGGR